MKRLLVVGLMFLLLAACGKKEPAFTDNGNPGQIKVFVFVDSNQNGVFDSDEKGAQVGTAISQEVSCPPSSYPTWFETDANGIYTFEDLKPGKYCVIINTSRSITSKMTQDIYVSSDKVSTATWSIAP
jgi:hypothetical protein